MDSAEPQRPISTTAKAGEVVEHFLGTDRAQVMLLGTFHFADAGLDVHQPRHGFDVFAQHRQAEVAEVLERLVRFQPTKIIVESRLEHAERLNEQYRAYQAGAYELTANEIDQLGFRLAARLGHERLYAADEWGRMYETPEALLAYARERLNTPAAKEMTEDELVTYLRGDWVKRYAELYQYDDAITRERTLREVLLYRNSKARLMADHGAYVTWLHSAVGDYTMADFVTGWWYNRNLRIFANIKSVTEPSKDRILAIFGAGHVPILRHCFESSPEFDLVEVAQYI